MSVAAPTVTEPLATAWLAAFALSALTCETILSSGKYNMLLLFEVSTKIFETLV
jgi:hypothetical protein